LVVPDLAALTVSDTEFEASPLELVTCTVHVRAVVPTLTGTWITVLLTEVTVPTVALPQLPSATFSPDTNPLPLMVSV
jgi:hypothetical protein